MGKCDAAVKRRIPVDGCPKLRPDWFPDWRGDIAAIIASGPSATKEKADECRAAGVRVIAVNTSFRLAPWADVLYAADPGWWKQYGPELGEFAGLKIGYAALAGIPWPGVHGVPILRDGPKCIGEFVFDRPGDIGGGGNSGFQAINLATQFGACKQLWIGFDMRLDRGAHWHGDHPRGLSNPNRQAIERWRATLDKQAPILLAHGIDVVNCSPVSALTAYRKMSIAEALEMWRSDRQPEGQCDAALPG